MKDDASSVAMGQKDDQRRGELQREKVGKSLAIVIQLVLLPFFAPP